MISSEASGSTTAPGDETGTTPADDTDGGGPQPVPEGGAVTTVRFEALAATDGTLATFGQVFRAGDLAPGFTLLARDEQDTPIRLQVDAKATHADGSLRHAVLTAELPAMELGESLLVELVASENGIAGDAVALADVLDSTFDAGLTLDLGGEALAVSARDALDSEMPTPWLSGPLVSEWHVVVPLMGAGEHPHLQARVAVRAHLGLEAARASFVVENAWSFAEAPQNYVYDAAVVVGEQTVLSQTNVTHYRQSRWRRAFWWGDAPEIHVIHDADYLWQTGAVPRYDPSLAVSDEALTAMQDEWTGPMSELMGNGVVDPYMPGTGARRDIGPLPRWAARYLLSQDERALASTVRASEQAASWPIHYRNRETGLPHSVELHPEVSLLGSTTGLPPCAGDCESPYYPDVAHQPSLAYVPYLLTGDHYHLEELQFWAAYNAFHWGDHGGELGLLYREQVRAQAWGLRTLAHAAYLSPDDDPMRAYFERILANNLEHYAGVDAPEFGYLPQLDPDMNTSFWMDDFFTWAIGHVSELGFQDAAAVHAWKAAFPVERMTHPDFCFVLAGVNWIQLADAGTPRYATWAELYQGIIADPGAISPSFTGDAIRSQVDAFNAAACGGAEMAAITGYAEGTMIGYPSNPESYSAILGPALATAVGAQLPGADAAWQAYQQRGNVYDPPLDDQPNFAIVPRE